MTKQVIAVGTSANDGTGDTLRVAFQKTNANFTELYDADGALDTRLSSAESSVTDLADADTMLAGGISANGGAITTLQGTTGTHTTQIAALQSADTALAAADTALAARATALEVARTRVARVTVDQLAIGTAYADVTGLVFSIEANTTYSFDFNVYADTDATTTGIDIAVNGPASPNFVNYLQGRYSTTQFYLETIATVYDLDTASTGVATTPSRVFRCRGIVSNGPNAGNLACRIKREAVGSGPNVRVGSFGSITKLF